MTDIEKETFLRKCFGIKDELGLPSHFLKAYNVFEHILGLTENGQVVPQGLMNLYRSTKCKNDALNPGLELSNQTFIILTVLHEMLGPSEATVRPVGSAVAKRRGRPPKVCVPEAVTA